MKNLVMGDSDERATLEAAYLMAAGIPFEFVFVLHDGLPVEVMCRPR